MINICFYFQVHQPKRLRQDYTFFEIGADHNYQDQDANRFILNKVAEKCYLPANQMMLDLIAQYKQEFRIAYSITGIVLEQFKQYNPAVIDSFKRLADTGCVEFINETYYHSLAFLYSKEEFKRQIQKHYQTIQELFGQKPTTFRNTELIYNNELASFIEGLGCYEAILTEGADQILGWRSPNFVYQPAGCFKLKALLKNYRLSDDIAFRFSNPSWDRFPLMTEEFSNWIHSSAGQGEVINLFMDYETFGEHQWQDTGIFEFFKVLPRAILDQPDFCFKTPAQVAKICNPMAQLDVPFFISWADVERDTSAWLGNQMQKAASELVYSLESEIYATKDQALIEDWRNLLTSDHFYYMCTKWFSDGDVHKYFNPFSSPHQAYITYMNILNDLKERIKGSCNAGNRQ